MELTAEQKQVVAGWVHDGAGLSDVQKRLKEEMGISMTYMDVRFLVIDLDVQLQEPEEEAVPEVEEVDAAVEALQDELDAAADELDGDGAVSGEVDALLRPGALVSGSVTFSDGVSATWLVDQMGRFGLEPSQPGYQPSQEDLMQLQTKLQEALSRMGY